MQARTSVKHFNFREKLTNELSLHFDRSALFENMENILIYINAFTFNGIRFGSLDCAPFCIKVSSVESANFRLCKIFSVFDHRPPFILPFRWYNYLMSLVKRGNWTFLVSTVYLLKSLKSKISQHFSIWSQLWHQHHSYAISQSIEIWLSENRNPLRIPNVWIGILVSDVSACRSYNCFTQTRKTSSERQKEQKFTFPTWQRRFWWS